MNVEEHKQIEFSALKSKKITAVFDDPDVSSDGGLMFLREAMARNNIAEQIAGSISDRRHDSYIAHTLSDLIIQRVGQIASGYEDSNDCDAMRNDPVLKMLAGRSPEENPLASQPTMSRLENEVSVRDLIRIGNAFVDNFISSFRESPRAVVLDIDPTADHVHGHQQLALFNAHEREYCFMPFHVYDGLTGRLITTVLRAGKTPRAHEIISVLKRIERRLRKAWPNTMIIMRGDSHHTKHEVMDWMESKGMGFITGLQPNPRLEKLFDNEIREANDRFRRTKQPVRMFASDYYCARIWNRPQRVICRILVSESGVDLRYIVTSFQCAPARYLYENVYSGRGKMELMIKDHKTALKSDRTSCHRKEANQFRLFLHSAAYVLLHWLRENMLKGSDLASAQFDTIRLKLLKLGARIESKKTLVRIHFPLACPYQKAMYRGMTMIDTG